MSKSITSCNCDASAIEELNGYVIEQAYGCTDASGEGFQIVAYKEVSGVKVYREFCRDDGEYYISEEYIPNHEKEGMKGETSCTKN